MAWQASSQSWFQGAVKLLEGTYYVNYNSEKAKDKPLDYIWEYSSSGKKQKKIFWKLERTEGLELEKKV